MKLERILYVEDDADIREVVCMALEVIGGFTVRACSSGVEALTVAQAFAPDLAVLDVMMPDLDGPGTLRGLRALRECAELPVIFVTAKVQPSEVAEFLEMGVLDVVAKPFDPMTLPASIDAIWQRHQVGRQRMADSAPPGR